MIKTVDTPEPDDSERSPQEMLGEANVISELLDEKEKLKRARADRDALREALADKEKLVRIWTDASARANVEVAILRRAIVHQVIKAAGMKWDVEP